MINFYKHLKKVESCQDAKGSDPNGFEGFYNLNEQLDSCGKVIDGKKHEEWF